MKNIISQFKKQSKTTNKIKAVSNRVRVVIYKSLKFDYIEAIDDSKNVIICGLSTQKIEGKTKKDKSQILGENFAKLLLKKNIKNIVFDRKGYKYHGRIKIICDTMRKNGINF